MQIKRKKKRLRCFGGSLETYFRYSRVADEEEKIPVILLKGAMAFLISLKGPFSKSLGNSAIKHKKANELEIVNYDI